MTAPGTGLYVYGIVRAGRSLPARCTGLGTPPAPPRLLPSGRVAAVVSEAPTGLRPRRRDLTAHQELLLELALHGPVLPMRFGMVSPDEPTVLEELAASEQTHLECLEQLEGRLELNIKALPVEDSLASLVREDETVRRLREEVRRRPGYETSVRLGEAVAAGLAARATAASAEAEAELAPLAVRLVEGPGVTGCVRNTSFLVARSAEADFRAAATRLAALHSDAVELRLTGPLPCYSFVGPQPAPATGRV